MISIKAPALIASCLLWIATVGQAAIISITSDSADSTEGLASFTGTLEYLPGTGVLKVNLTNTTPNASGGYLVAFAFNNPGGITDVTSLTTATNLDNILGGTDYDGEINVAPFGSWDIGASLTSDWLGGGSPNGGVPTGGSGSWEFTFAGTGLNLLTTQSFVDALQDDEFFLVRFRGIQVGAGSDKVPALVVPEASASSLSLLALGAFGLVVGVARRRVLPC